jgi:tetratricopeptide (TPR) repeat protein
MKFIITALLLLFALNALSQNQYVQGKVYFINSHKLPAVDVEVTGQGSNPDHSKADGSFQLKFPDKSAGDPAGLDLGTNPKDKDGKALELVNPEIVHHILIPKKGGEDVFIIVCQAGGLVAARERYFQLTEPSLRIKYQQKIRENEVLISQNKNNLKFERVLQLRSDSLRNQLNNALENLHDLTGYIASVDKDFAPTFIQEAIDKIENQQDIEGALAILNKVRLMEVYNQELTRKKAANERILLAKQAEQDAENDLASANKAIEDVLEGFKLRIKVSSTLYDYNDVLDCYQKAIAICEENNLPNLEITEWYNEYGLTLNSIKKYDRAIVYFNKVISIYETMPANNEYLSVVYSNIGMPYQGKGDFAIAKDYFEKALKLTTPNTDTIALSSLYNNLAANYMALDSNNKALDYQQKSISLLLKTDAGIIQMTRRYNNLAMVFKELGQYQQASNIFLMLIDEIKRNPKPDLRLLASLYNNLGQVYADKGDTELAIEYYKLALVILESPAFSGIPDLGDCYGNLASAYQEAGQLKLALSIQQKATQIDEALYDGSNPSLVDDYNTTAFILKDLGNNKEALKFQKRSVAIAGKIYNDHQYNLASAYKDLALIYDANNYRDSALRCLDRAFAIANRLPESNELLLARIYNDYSTVLCNLDSLSHAAEYSKKSIDIYERKLNPNDVLIAVGYNNLAMIYEGLKKIPEALAYEQKACTIYEKKYPLHPNLAVCYDNTSIIYQDQKDYGNAVNFEKKAIDIAEKIYPPDNPILAEYYRSAGWSCVRGDQNELALSYFEKVIPIYLHNLSIPRSKLASAYKGRALTFEKLDNRDRAIDDIELSLDVMRKEESVSSDEVTDALSFSATLLYERGLEDYKNGQFLKAIPDLIEVNRLDAQPAVENLIGLSYYNTKQYSSAIKYYKMIIDSRDTTEKGVYNNIGLAYAKIGQFAEAKKALTIFEEKHMDEARAARDWAVYYALQKQSNLAISYLKKAIEKGYNDKDWLTHDDGLASIRSDVRYMNIVNGLKVASPQTINQ